MRKIPAFELLAGMTVLAVLVVSIPGYAADLPRHKNPAQIKEENFFPIQLISIYAQVVNLQLKGRWDEASSRLKKTLFSYVPESIRYILTRFNDLLQTTGNKLKKVKKGIDSAQIFLQQGEIEEAVKTLEDTWMTLLKAERDINNLSLSVDELRGKIGAGIAEKLREKIAPLNKLAKKYKDKIQNLYQQARQEKRLEHTYLKIFVLEKKVVVGGSFEISGKLETEGKQVLEGRKVDIFLENKKIFEMLTGKDGEFKTKINFPFLYKKDVFIFASFVPEGEDKGKFYPSVSNKVSLKPIFYTPEIKVNYKGPVYPVLPFKLKGKLTLKDKALANYPVKIKLPQNTVFTITNNKGEFQTELSPPSDTGKFFSLVIFTPPKGIIAPASLTLNIPLSYKKPVMIINLPLVVVVPFPWRISGKAYLKDGILDGAKIEVVAGGEEMVDFVQEGNFKLRFNVPLSRFSGWQKIRVFLQPQDAWILPLMKEEKVLVINPVTLLPFLGLVVLFAKVSRKKGRKEERIERMVEKEKKVEQQKRDVEKEGPVGLVKIYMEAVDFVGKYTGIQQTQGDTIREYLKLVRKPLGEKYDDFEFISSLTEKFLYAPSKVRKDKITGAGERLSKLKLG